MLIGKNPLNEAPEWFVKNIAERPEECSVNVNGANVKYFIWGDKCLLFNYQLFFRNRIIQFEI